MKKVIKIAIVGFIAYMAWNVFGNMDFVPAALEQNIAKIVETVEEETKQYGEMPSFDDGSGVAMPTLERESSDIEVTFIDIGQGDSILIQDHGQTMLIDTGYYANFDKLEKAFQEKGVTGIDVLVLTHPDADHIGSAASIVSYYDASTIYMAPIEKDSASYGYLMDAVENFDVQVKYPSSGDLISFGTATYEVVGPVPGVNYEDANSWSIIVKMTNGEDTFLFTGDATGEEIEDVLKTGVDLSADVLKAAHHGSANDGCNNDVLFDAVQPDALVVSCELGNKYGHPHRETMEQVQTRNISLYRTDLQGTISCVSTGSGIRWRNTPSTDYRNGNSIQ